MELLTLFKAALLGIIEGLTEFLPVSSTGHLIIAADLLGFTGRNAETFEIAIQLGAILGVAFDYRRRLAQLVLNLRQPREFRLARNLLIAFLPAAIIGLLFHQQIKTHLFNPVIKFSAFKATVMTALFNMLVSCSNSSEVIQLNGWKI